MSSTIGRLSLVALALMANLSFANVSRETVVYPTGKYPDDVNNVQAAVSAGGTVILKAVNKAGVPTAFNFLVRTTTDPGPDPAGVNLDTDIRLLGERKGNAMTTVKGGFIVLLGVAAVRYDVEGIAFDQPRTDAMLFLRSKDLKVMGNHIRDTVPEIRDLPNFPSKADGIDVYASIPRDFTAITGQILISENEIDIQEGEVIQGIQVESVGANAEISRNTIHVGGDSAGCEAICDNVYVAYIAGSTEILDNWFTAAKVGPEGLAAPIYLEPASPSSHLSARDNVIGCEASACYAINVAAQAPLGESINNASVQNNLIWTQSEGCGICLYGPAKGSRIVNNAIFGQEDNAVGLTWELDPATEVQTNTVISGNDMRGFKTNTGGSDIMLDVTAQRTTGTDLCRTVEDDGTRNHVTCLHPQVSGTPAAESFAEQANVRSQSAQATGRDLNQRVSQLRAHSGR